MIAKTIPNWRRMNDWTDEEWEEYIAWMYPSQDQVLQDVQDAINNTRDSDEVTPT